MERWYITATMGGVLDCGHTVYPGEDYMMINDQIQRGGHIGLVVCLVCAAGAVAGSV